MILTERLGLASRVIRLGRVRCSTTPPAPCGGCVVSPYQFAAHHLSPQHSYRLLISAAAFAAVLAATVAGSIAVHRVPLTARRDASFGDS